MLKPWWDAGNEGIVPIVKIEQDLPKAAAIAGLGKFITTKPKTDGLKRPSFRLLVIILLWCNYQGLPCGFVVDFEIQQSRLGMFGFFPFILYMSINIFQILRNDEGRRNTESTIKLKCKGSGSR